MRRYSETSSIYTGAGTSLYLIEGRKDKALNRYLRGQINSIDRYLRQRGAAIAAFNIISPAMFGSRSLKSLILRQKPACSKEELEKEVKLLKEKYRNNRSRLLYICGTEFDGEGNCSTGIISEEDFGGSDSYATVLYRFLDAVVHNQISRSNNATGERGNRYRFPEEETALHEESRFLGDDLLADSICEADENIISPIRFDSKFNIYLPLYPQINIKLEPLPKALYILFLHHPEGIILKEMQDYENEFRSIYCTVSGRRNPTVVNRMFKAINDPTDNILHKTLSIIRHCFMSKLNYSIARNYIPSHGRAKAHSIPIDSALVEMPEIA